MPGWLFSIAIATSLLALSAQTPRPPVRAMRVEADEKVQSRLTIAPPKYVASKSPLCGDAAFDGSRIPADLKKAASAVLSQSARSGLGVTDSLLNQTAGARLRPLVRQSLPRRGDASCVRLLVVLPKSARVTRILKDLQCPAGGWCAFSGEPVTEAIDANTFGVSIVARNWSPNQPATASLDVFFRR